MSDDEQRVRTLAGQIGVEISRSRVRTEGKAGYGLYRVRAAAERHWHVPHPKVGPDGEWTPYAFRLQDVLVAVNTAIEQGTPSGPAPLRLAAWPELVPVYRVLTRWTPAYQGRRDIGVHPRYGAEREGVSYAESSVEEGGVPVALKPEFAAEVSAMAALVDEALVRMTHVQGCLCDDDRYTAACVAATGQRPIVDGETVRQRQRAANGEFQAAHLERRRYGLEQRHAAKLGRNAAEDNDGM